MEKRITKDLLTYLPAKALPGLAAFITVPIYTHLFTPSEFGYYTLAVAAAEFLLLGTTTGFGQAAVRYFSKYQLVSNLSNYYSSVFISIGLITVATSLICVLILLIFGSLISTILYPLLWAALLLFIVSAVNSILMDVLRGQEKSKLYSTIWIGQTYGGIAVGLILVLVFGFGIEGLILGQSIGLIVVTIPLIFSMKKSFPKSSSSFHRSDFKQLWSFAFPYTFGNIAFWSLSLADRYIIEVIRGSHEVGLYSIASKLSSKSIQLLVGLFFLVPAPIISRLWEEKGRKATEEALTSFTRMFLLMIIPAVTGLIVVSSPLIRLIADEAYYDGHRAIWLVAIASMGLGLSDLGSSGCMVTNNTKRIALNQCVAAFAGLILNFILVPRMGFMGAAISAAVCFSLLAFLQSISSAKFLTWRWPTKTLWHVVVASLAMSVFVLFLQRGFPVNTTLLQVLNLLLSIGVGTLIYGVVLYILGEISLKSFLVYVNKRPQISKR